jgi:hypothetical protein
MSIKHLYSRLREAWVFTRFHWLPLAVPFLGLAYGVGDNRGWWDDVTGRSQISEAIERIASPDGFPVAFIYAVDPAFEPLERFISQRTRNREVKRRFQAGHRPRLITRAGGGERTIPVPKGWPKFISVPGESPIIYSYDANPPNQIGRDILWAATLEQARSWIQRSRSTEQMWFTVILLGVLSIMLVFHESRGNETEEESKRITGQRNEKETTKGSESFSLIDE